MKESRCSAGTETIGCEAAMKNTFGNTITLTVFGESHGPAIGGVLDGLPPGLKIDEEDIRKMNERRRPAGKTGTARREADQPEFLSGVKDGYSEGTPLAFIIRNTDVKRHDYDALTGIARPGHADYSAQMKYLGYQDASGGGHFSGRLTAVLTTAGAILMRALEEKGILIGTHISVLGGIEDQKLDTLDPADQLRELRGKQFAVLNEEAGEKMRMLIEQTAEQKDSVGGILETGIAGLPAGIGEPFFDSLESMLAHVLFSIPAVKGLEFGSGFGFAEMKGSEASDPFALRNDRVVTLANHNGGVNGGISNGMPVILRTAYKPVSSIGKPQKTVSFEKMEETEIEIQGRHDPAIVHRACAVQDAVCALVIADMLAVRYGTLWLKGGCE